MNKAKGSLLALAALLLVVLAGCGGELTAETLAQKMIRAARKAQITQTTATIGLAMDVAGAAEPEQAALRTVIRMQLSADPKAGYAETDALIRQGELVWSDLEETWLRPEGEQLAAYSRTGSTSQWIRRQSEPAGEGGFGILAEKTPEQWTLAPERQELGRVDAYLLTIRLTGEELASVLGGVAELQRAMGELSWQNGQSIETTFYLDPHSWLPLRIELRQQGALAPGGLTGRLLEQSGLPLNPETGWLHAYYDEIFYTAAELPALPAEGLASAVSEEQLEAGDAQYVIEENGQQACLRPADGWQAYGHRTDEVSVISADGVTTATFTMYTPDADSSFFLPRIEEQEIPALQIEGSYIAHFTGPRLGGFETLWIECADHTVYFAWGKAGDACLYLRAVRQESGPQDEQAVSAVLRELLAMIAI